MVTIGLQLHCHEMTEFGSLHCVQRDRLDAVVWIVFPGVGTLLAGGFVWDILRQQTLQQKLPTHVRAQHLAIPNFNKAKPLSSLRRLAMESTMTLYDTAKSELAADDKYKVEDEGPKLEWFWLNTGCNLRSISDHRNLAAWFAKEQLLEVCVHACVHAPGCDCMTVCLRAPVRVRARADTCVHCACAGCCNS